MCIFAPVHIHTDVRVYQKEAKTLALAGYSVTLIARKAIGEEQDQIQIIGVPRYKNRLQRFLLQPLMLRDILRTKASIVHLHNPDTLLLGFLLKIMGKRVVYDTHEDFRERILMREWIPKLLRTAIAKAVSSLEALAGRVFDASIATQEDVAKRMGEKSIVIENAPISQGELIDKAYEYSKSFQSSSCFRAIYVGTIGKSRGLQQMVDAMEHVNKHISARLWLIGPVHDELNFEKMKKRPGWKYVDYVGYLPQEMAFAHIIRSNVGLITIQDVGDHAKTSPNKIFEYQRFGIPFIASDFPAWRKKVGHVGSGVFVNQNDPYEIAQVMTYLFDQPQVAKAMGQKGMDFTVNVYNWENESEKLVGLYQSLTGSTKQVVGGVSR